MRTVRGELYSNFSFRVVYLRIYGRKFCLTATRIIDCVKLHKSTAVPSDVSFCKKKRCDIVMAFARCGP